MTHLLGVSSLEEGIESLKVKEITLEGGK